VLGKEGDDTTYMEIYGEPVPPGVMAVSEEETTYVEADTVDFFEGGDQLPPEQGGGGQMYYQRRSGPYWALDHYQPITGKLIGVYPDNRYSQARLTELYLKWGFRGVIVDPDYSYNMAVSVGFHTSDMMVPVHWDNYNTVVPNYPAGGYYYDEPTEHGCFGRPARTQNQLEDMGNFIRSYNRKFFIGGYKRCTHFINAGSAADFVMYSSYKNWNEWLPECWLPGSSDQRDSWSDMRNWFGQKFVSTWISGRVSSSTCGNESDIDSGEYNQLIGHANNLGLRGIWFFIGCGTSENEIANFMWYAWLNGWVRRFEYKYYIIWRCLYQGPGDCDPSDPMVWFIWGYEYTGECREYFPSGGWQSGQCIYH